MLHCVCLRMQCDVCRPSTRQARAFTFLSGAPRRLSVCPLLPEGLSGGRPPGGHRRRAQVAERHRLTTSTPFSPLCLLPLPCRPCPSVRQNDCLPLQQSRLCWAAGRWASLRSRLLSRGGKGKRTAQEERCNVGVSRRWHGVGPMPLLDLWQAGGQLGAAAAAAGAAGRGRREQQPAPTQQLQLLWIGACDCLCDDTVRLSCVELLHRLVAVTREVPCCHSQSSSAQQNSSLC